MNAANSRQAPPMQSFGVDAAHAFRGGQTRAMPAKRSAMRWERYPTVQTVRRFFCVPRELPLFDAILLGVKRGRQASFA